MAFAEIAFENYEQSVPAALDGVHAGQILAGQARVLVKPNLVNSSPPPVTTPLACVEAVIAYVRAHSAAEVVIAEGCGAADVETSEVFDRLGYTDMAERLGVELVDLNTADTIVVREPSCRIFPRFYLPAIAREAFIVSVPVLKAHSLADITGTLKNMMGFAPPRYYQQGGHWKKSAFHARMHQSIVELNRYCRADLTLMDASIGLAEFHLGGPECSPPVQKILAGFDGLEIDRRAAELLGLEWREIPHLAGD